jgi:fatty-acyl-CoA synthase
MLSYASGVSSQPLLGETIGENLRRTVANHGDAEALVVPHQQFRATYHQLWELVSLAARGLLARGVAKGDRVGIWAPNRFEWVVVQFATARIGAILVNINPAYRTSELEYALRQSGVSFLLLARAFRQADYVGMLGAVKGACPDLREALVLEDGWESLLRDGESVSQDALAAVEAELQLRRPDQYPVHVWHDRIPEGRNAVAPQHPEQRLLHRRRGAVHLVRSRLHPRAVLSLLRHGARQPRMHHARRLHRRSG